jgi:AcrR family transcriptional regulator
VPKETFFNLPSDKRERITQIAIDEFGKYEYADVSISRIVARAGIAKGSFYQYFEDKEDLYSYLLDLILQKKREMLSLDHPDPQHIGIFRYLRWMVEAGVQFELAYRDLWQVGYRAMNRNAYPEPFYTRARQEAHLFYKRLVALGKEQGDLRAEIDEDLAAFFFVTIFLGLGQYLAPHLAAHEANGHEKVTFFERPDVVSIFEQTVLVLEQGMGSARPFQEINEKPTTKNTKGTKNKKGKAKDKVHLPA